MCHANKTYTGRNATKIHQISETELESALASSRKAMNWTMIARRHPPSDADIYTDSRLVEKCMIVFDHL